MHEYIIILSKYVHTSLSFLEASGSSNPTNFTQFMMGLVNRFVYNHPNTEANQPLLFDPIAVAYVIDAVHASKNANYKSSFKTATYHIEVDYKSVSFYLIHILQFN